MTNVTIRPAVASERRELEALQVRSSLGNPGDRDAILAHPDAIDLPADQIASGRVFVAEREGEIMGFSVVLPRGDGGAELDGLFVDPKRWRQGIGRLLVIRSAEVAQRRGARALHVVGNPHAEAFYLSCGFETIGITETRFGKGLSMRKPLEPAGNPAAERLPKA